jgi:predicted RNA polymerase sigma factor
MLSRTGAGAELIPLAQQDRALWDRQQIAEGVALLSATLPKGAVGPYQLQAAIAAVHDEAARADETDWPQILALYDLLTRMSDNPIGCVESRHRRGDGARRNEGLGATGPPQN